MDETKNFDLIMRAMTSSGSSPFSSSEEKGANDHYLFGIFEQDLIHSLSKLWGKESNYKLEFHVW